jgi:hypothetical protein
LPRIDPVKANPPRHSQAWPGNDPQARGYRIGKMEDGHMLPDSINDRKFAVKIEGPREQDSISGEQAPQRYAGAWQKKDRSSGGYKGSTKNIMAGT